FAESCLEIFHESRRHRDGMRPPLGGFQISGRDGERQILRCCRSPAGAELFSRDHHVGRKKQVFRGGGGTPKMATIISPGAVAIISRKTPGCSSKNRKS